ncbi:ribonucleoside-diphosphate reductase subunit beta [Spirochaetota bacterium]|nr:ribonucleoside-diphosphate reductase subunit beta [Spirochaetota bacterium]
MASKKFENLMQDFKVDKKTNSEIINKRRVINGEDDGLMQVSPLKHPFADEIFKTMLHNNWVPQEVYMGKDLEMWKDPKILTENERRVFERSLAFVSNLDGIQTDNITSNILRQITSPEITLALIRQAYEEALHVHSYSTMVEALELDPEEIYGMYRRDQGLYEKNQYVLKSLSKISGDKFKTGTFENDQAFLEACVSNIILEGIYFYSAFMIFYTLKRNNKMPGSAEMIQFINRDEDLHLRLFIKIVNEIKKEQPELWTEDFKQIALQNIIGAVEHEVGWGKSCINEGILGLNHNNLEQYIRFVADMRLLAIGMKPHYNVTNPFPWIENFTQGAMTEVNFFEGTVREYATGTLQW